MYSSHLVGENKIENIVAEGKGLNIYASKTATMGTPKLTILESSNVGIVTATPKGRLHTSGGTVFINDEITNNGTYKHLGTPLVVSNALTIANTTDFTRVLELCREGGTTSSDGVRATFKMGKHTAVSSGTANSQLDIFLASTNYETEIDVISLRSDGLVGIGTTIPTAHLEVHCTGAANPTTNGLLVHNFDGDSGDAILAAQTRQLTGNIFTSYIQTNAGSNPRGWSTGVTGTNSDFRITQNVSNNKDSATVGLYIDGANGMCIDLSQDEFLILLRDRDYMMHTLVHELVHTKQYMKQDLGKHLDARSEEYDTAWWEVEARNLTKQIMESYSEFDGTQR